MSAIDPACLKFRTCLLALAALTLLGAAPATAVAESLTEAHARQAFALAENWVRRADVPKQTLALPVDDAVAVQVTIRLRGVALGRATTAVDRPVRQAEDEPIDLMNLTRSATVQALTQAREKFKNVYVKLPKGLVEPGKDPIFDDISGQLLLDLQIARAPVQLVLTNRADIATSHEPGLEGLAMRDGGKWAWQFPAQTIIANLSIEQQLAGLLRDLGLEAADLNGLMKAKDPSLLKFEVLQLVRLHPKVDVARLHRGELLEPLRPLSTDAMRALATDLTRHLINRQQRGGAFAGTYVPVADQYDPPLAGNADAALACFVLARVSRTPGLDPKLRELAAETANVGIRRVLRDMGLIRPDEQVETTRWHVGEAAMALIALLETPKTDDLKDHAERLGGALLTMQTPQGRFRMTPARDGRMGGYASQGLAAYAMARAYHRNRDEKTYARAQGALADIWKNLPADKLVTSLPWLAMAEFELASLDKSQPGLLRLRQGMAAIDRYQRDLSAARRHAKDTIGGYAFEIGFIDDPTWLSCSVLAAKARGLRIDAFHDPDDQAACLMSLGLGMRFVRQLSMQPTDLYYAAEPRRADGGVRPTLWSSKLPLSATSMALLSVVETLEAIDSLK